MQIDKCLAREFKRCCVESLAATIELGKIFIPHSLLMMLIGLNDRWLLIRANYHLISRNDCLRKDQCK